MRAPVYRHLDLEPRFLGLVFPGQVLGVLAAFWPAALLLRPSLALLVVAAVYVAVRAATAGKPVGFVTQLCGFHWRRLRCAGLHTAFPRVPLQGPTNQIHPDMS